MVVGMYVVYSRDIQKCQQEGSKGTLRFALQKTKACHDSLGYLWAAGE